MSNTRASLTACPQEILDMICDHLTPVPDDHVPGNLSALIALCQACKQTNASATPSLYSALSTQYSAHHVDGFVHMVVKRIEHATRVKHISIKHWPLQMSDKFHQTWQMISADATPRLGFLCDALQSFNPADADSSGVQLCALIILSTKIQTLTVELDGDGLNVPLPKLARQCHGHKANGVNLFLSAILSARRMGLLPKIQTLKLDMGTSEQTEWRLDAELIRHCIALPSVEKIILSGFCPVPGDLGGEHFEYPLTTTVKYLSFKDSHLDSDFLKVVLDGCKGLVVFKMVWAKQQTDDRLQRVIAVDFGTIRAALFNGSPNLKVLKLNTMSGNFDFDGIDIQNTRPIGSLGSFKKLEKLEIDDAVMAGEHDPETLWSDVLNRQTRNIWGGRFVGFFPPNLQVLKLEMRHDVSTIFEFAEMVGSTLPPASMEKVTMSFPLLEEEMARLNVTALPVNDCIWLEPMHACNSETLMVEVWEQGAAWQFAQLRNTMINWPAELVVHIY